MTTARLVFVRKALTPLATAGLLALGLATSALADPTPEDTTPDLLTTVGGWEKAGNLESDAAVRGLAVKVRSDLLERGIERFGFQDFHARAFEAELERLDHPMPGGTTWIGRVAEFGEHSQVLLSTYEGAVSGYLDTPEARYEIVPRPGGHVMVKLDPSRFAACGTGVAEDGEHTHDLDAETRREAAATLGLDPTALATQLDDPAAKFVSLIEIVVFYTDRAKDQAGGTSGISSTIISAASTLNSAFWASDIDALVRVLAITEADKLGDSSGGGDGAAMALFGDGSSFSLDDEQQLFENLPSLSGRSESGDGFGEALARGDFDGDGYDDLAIGVPGEDLSSDTIANTGLVWILYGSSDGFDLSQAQKFSQSTPGMPDSNEPGDGFGSSLAVGDFDGDLYDDLAIGVPSESLGLAYWTGRVQILYGSAGGLSTSGSLSFDQSALSGETRGEGDHFGTALASGDFDADGYADLAIGTPDKDLTEDLGPLGTIVTRANFGRVAVVYGSSGGLDPDDHALFDQDSDGIGDSAESGDRFGRALVSGDFDDDGHDDLAIGVPQEDQGNQDSGLVHILFGSPAGLSASGSSLLTQSTLGGSAEEKGDQFGFSLAVGDFDGDGVDDLVVGAPYENRFEPDVGEINLLYGGSPWLSGGGVSITGDQAKQYLGYALASADFDGDGYDDVAVGQPGFDRNDGQSNEIADFGVVEIFHGGTSGLTEGDPRWSQNLSNLEGSPEEGDFWGASLATGDFDDDGHPDLVVGVPGEGVSNDVDYHLLWLGSSSQVADLRSQSGADLVGLVAEHIDDYCGAAVAIPETTAGDSSAFYQATKRSCAVGNLTFAHEIGHLLGLGHDPGNGGGTCDDAHGHYVDQQGRTLMSYSSYCTNDDCTRLGIISDPDIDFDFGDPSGITGERDNARCARLIVPNVAAYN